MIYIILRRLIRNANLGRISPALFMQEGEQKIPASRLIALFKVNVFVREKRCDSIFQWRNLSFPMTFVGYFHYVIFYGICNRQFATKNNETCNHYYVLLLPIINSIPKFVFIVFDEYFYNRQHNFMIFFYSLYQIRYWIFFIYIYILEKGYRTHVFYTTCNYFPLLFFYFFQHSYMNRSSKYFKF